MKTHLTLLIAALAALQFSTSAFAQTAPNVNWTGGAGHWVDTSRWFNESTATTGFLPSVDFNEIARIDGGVVTVNTALANGSDQGASTNPGSVRLGSVSGAGELIIANGGSLRV